MDKLLYTTYDQDKVNDLQEILGELNLDIEVIGLSSIDYAPQKSYSEETFLNNARNTAHRLAEYTKLPTLSESSGLSVDYLFNLLEILPYHHNGQDDKARLLGYLGGVPSEKRTASYYTTFAFSWPGQEDNDIVSSGRISGVIAKYPFGNSTYVYDSSFVVPKLGKTFGEMNIDERNQVSQRRAALDRLLADLPSWWQAQKQVTTR
ncbi:non-canonical purine NTP pyrophosphatase [Lactobacillus helveticus]|uniref:non-canonical purine NTP pyrophosphatase n=2 Tax=Lactobacillus helveticus TaxID=1587 RepID=UPI001563A597|nr:non-canonical purine NTP pyrophosphatase [Lactobacillus helveticus]NRO15958.1 dITP/XTP pyrophosphatase [Lactobacillus helveticus]